jgi:processive 1,2-diacylglycerol beta-glucosyltransferase
MVKKLMRKKRVLLLSEGFGAGHTQAAQALSVGLRMLSPDIQTRVLELGSFLHPTLAPWILNAYRKTVTTQPKLYGLMYRSQYKKSLNRFAQLALHRIFYAQTAAVIHQLRPDTIVCTHPLPNAVISRLKRAGLNIPLCTVITDYDVHGTWVSSEVNKYLVSTSNVRDKLLTRGVQSDAIKVTGIPVHPNFWEPHNREELRAQFGLKAMPTVLVMGGGWGLMNSKESLDYFTRWREKVQLIICLGNNDKTLAELSQDERFQHKNIRLMGFTREVDKWMEVSDLLITKPGGMTCTEGLSKGIPMLFYQPIPGQEEENMHYFTQRGYGEPIKSEATIDHWFQLLIDRYSEVSKKSSDFNPYINTYNPTDCSQAIMEMLRVNVLH